MISLLVKHLYHSVVAKSVDQEKKIQENVLYKVNFGSKCKFNEEGSNIHVRLLKISD